MLVLAGCQSTGGTAQPAKAERRPSAISFVSDADMLSALLRQAGPMINNGGVVIMNGAARAVVPAQNFQGVSTSSFAATLAEAATLERAKTPYYEFLYPKGYEVLAKTDFSFEGRLAKNEATASFGDGTHLYNVCGILSQSLGLSIVADNIVADIMCGEVVIRDAPLSTVIEALLRSARATADAVQVEATDEYVFLHAAANTSPVDTLLNEAQLNAQQKALLANRINLSLPSAARRPGAAVFVDAAMQLDEVLVSLGQQLGVPVRAEEALRALPVNYTILNDVSVRTALNLIVRQWPVDKFGFTLDEAGVQFRAR